MKRATVLVQVAGPGWKGSGSGFVVATEKDGVLVATNYHVVAPPDHDKKARPTPSSLARSLREANVSVVFDSGTRSEVTRKDEPIAADVDNDLAVLRVAGLKEKPAPVNYRALPPLVETMQVYTFGFPFGQALSTSRGNPAITVGKGNVSSLRHDDEGGLAYVQIDGAINPGNSGGPVVDGKGRLIGVAVARIRDGQGIGLTVPAVDLVRLMNGRVCGLHAVAGRTAANTIAVRVEAGLADPAGAVRGVTLHYVVLTRGSAPPAGPLVKQSGARRAALRVAGGVATGELTFDPADAVVYLQAVPDGGAGADGPSPVHALALAPRGGNPTAGPPDLGPAPGPAPGNAGPAPSPPAGWVDYSPRDKTYTMWIPERPKSRSERERTLTVGGRPMKINTLTFEVNNGPVCLVEEAIFDGVSTEESRAELEILIRDMLARELRGRVVSQADVYVGSVPGKEYRIEAGRGLVRVRVFASGNWLFMLHVIGTRAAVESTGARAFLDSFRLSGGSRPGTPSPGTSAVPGPERRSRIQGGFNDPEWVEEAPPGGILCGVDVALGKFLNRNTIMYSARPVFRVGGGEVAGSWHGPTDGKQVVRLLARPGYAVGAITVKTGLGMDGVSVTFMRVAGGRLDASDSYESPWAGGTGGGAPVKVSGEGRLVVGLQGRAKDSYISGLGLLFAGEYRSPPGDESSSVPITSPGAGPGPSPEPPSVPVETTRTAPDSTEAAGESGTEKGANVPLIVGLTAALVVGLGSLIVGVIMMANRAPAGGVARRRRRTGRRDEDDNDRPRGRNRPSRDGD